MPRHTQQRALIRLRTRPLSASVHVALSTGGLLAITALVTGILLSTAVIVRVAKH